MCWHLLDRLGTIHHLTCFLQMRFSFAQFPINCRFISTLLHFAYSSVLMRYICSFLYDPCAAQDIRTRSRYAPIQWETFNDVAHWLGVYLDWSLYVEILIIIERYILCFHSQGRTFSGNSKITSNIEIHFSCCILIRDYNISIKGPQKCRWYYNRFQYNMLFHTSLQ